MIEIKKLSNFIPINRDLFEHPLWCEKRIFTKFEAWLFLLKEARFEDSKILDKGKWVLIRRGQYYASLRFLSKTFCWSTKKVFNFLTLLEQDDMIKKETLEETGQTVITLCNYDKYNTHYLVQETAKETDGKQSGNSEETKSNIDNIVNKEIIESFEVFFNEYHKITKLAKSDKAAALKKWKVLSKSERIKAYDNIQSFYDSLPNKNYCKKARTYLNDKNFNDEFTQSNFLVQKKIETKELRWVCEAIGLDRTGTHEQYLLDVKNKAPYEVKLLGYVE